MSVERPDLMWVVPHTHWDREWYEPHDVFRARLVMMLDGLLDVLEREPGYKFTMDGQSAAIEDYLEIRPEAEPKVRAAVERGQLAIGPFQILLDEFCCDGETIVRNLEHGIRSARGLGREMRVGYLPDMFGHASQMPQILRGFGIKDASLWRGVPAEMERHAFVWEALDGSEVRVEYLWDGYGNALKLFEPLEKLPALVDAYVTQHANWFQGEPILGMLGTDHMAPRPDLMEILREHSRTDPAIRLEMATVGEVVAARDHSSGALSALPRIRGELRSHARGNLLPGVFSIRTNLKAAMARAERGLATAERLDAWIGGPARGRFFDRGWGLVIESTAHDSVTGCGADDTADEVESRLQVAAHTARGALDTTLSRLAGLARVGDVAVFNQSGFARQVQAELVAEVQPTEVPAGVQVLEQLPTVIGDETVASKDLPRLVRRIHGQELFGKLIRGWEWTGEALVFTVADHAAGGFDLSEFTAVLDEKMAAADPDHEWRVVTRVPQSCRVLAAGPAAGLSTTTLGLATAASPEGPVRADASGMSHDSLRIAVRKDGTVNIHDALSGAAVEGALRIVDDGDRGDSYNFGPLAHGTVASPAAVEVKVLEQGPLRGRILIRRTYRLPSCLAADRSRRNEDTVDQVIGTELELRAGERFLRARISLVNQARDHRLRVLLPTGQSGVGGSVSAGQYGVTARGRTAEGGWGEYPLPTFPATRFVHAGGVAALLDKLVEYEVLDGPPDQLALTVLRSVGLMSVNVHPLRDEPAGMEVPTPGAQYLGKSVELSFAIDLSAPDWSDSDLVAHSDTFRFEPVAVAGRANRPGAHEPLVELQTEGRVALESLRRIDSGMEARFVNYSNGPQPLRVRGAGAWLRTDMTGAASSPVDDLWTLEVAGGEILTLRRHD